MNIKGVFQIWMKDGSYHEVDLKECHQWTREGCKCCPDFAAEHSDIATGGIGEDNDWTLTIVRTELGEEVINRMIADGTIVARPAQEDEEAMKLLRTLSIVSRRRWPKDADPAPAIGVPPPKKKKAARRRPCAAATHVRRRTADRSERSVGRADRRSVRATRAGNRAQSAQMRLERPDQLVAHARRSDRRELLGTSALPCSSAAVRARSRRSRWLRRSAPARPRCTCRCVQHAGLLVRLSPIEPSTTSLATACSLGWLVQAPSPAMATTPGEGGQGRSAAFLTSP